jgi:hypothetical protein
MNYKQFQQVGLVKDIPEDNLQRGDLATIGDITWQAARLGIR